MNRPDFITKNDWNLLVKKYKKNIKHAVKKIEKGYPVQYLIGYVDFYGYKINVNKNVLIPRFETETLLEKTIKYIEKFNMENASVLELGTGSGCISIVLKSEIPTLNITALDISRKALRLAKKNAKLNKTEITFIRKDLFKYNLMNTYDVIIGNLPYIKADDQVSKEVHHEPNNAVFTDKTGLSHFEKVFEITKDLENNYLIALEIDESMGESLKKEAKRYYKGAKIKIEKDLTGRDRYLFIYKN